MTCIVQDWQLVLSVCGGSGQRHLDGLASAGSRIIQIWAETVWVELIGDEWSLVALWQDLPQSLKRPLLLIMSNMQHSQLVAAGKIQNTSRLKARGLLHWNWTSQKLHKVTQRCFFGDLSSSLYLLLINSIQNHRSLCYIIFHLLITT